tara:strand:+ start:700 stop:1029 length:330 start_codon:yes stop_codon:yes gene_type:complete
MKFNFVSEPTSFPEYDSGDELMEVDEMILAEFFDTGKFDDYVAGYFLNFDEDTKVVSIVGEISEEEIEKEVGEYVDAEDILHRIELFSDEWDITWKSDQLIDHDGTVLE